MDKTCKDCLHFGYILEPITCLVDGQGRAYSYVDGYHCEELTNDNDGVYQERDLDDPACERFKGRKEYVEAMDKKN